MLGVAAAVVVVLVIGGLALGHIGPFASGHKTLAGGKPTAGSTTAPAQNPTVPATSSGASPRATASHSGKGKKPNPKKSLPAITLGSTGASSSPKPGSSKNPGTGSGTLTAYGPDLIANGTFADSTLSSWTYGTENALVEPGSGPGGVNAVRLTASPDAGIAQAVSGLTPGGHYLVTGWGQSVNDPVFIGAMNNDSADDGMVHFSVSSNSWQQGSVVFTLAKGQTSAVVFCVQKSGSGLCANLTFHAMHRS